MEDAQAFFRACQAPMPERLAELLSRRPELVATWDGQPRCPRIGLMYAAHAGRVANVELLLAKAKAQGADILNERTNGGATALWYAASVGKNDCVYALLEAGADPCLAQVTAQGVSRTPLDIARENNHVQVVTVLEAWVRVYLICKARRIGDDSRSLTMVASSSVPPHLLQRVATHGRTLNALPRVEVHLKEGGNAAGGAAGQCKAEGVEGTNGEKAYAAEVAAAALECALNLSREVFVDLREMVWGPGMQEGERRKRRRLRH